MEKCLSVSEMMNSLGVSRSTAYALIRTPGFPAARIGKRIVISENMLRNWLSQGGTEQKKEV